MHPKRQNELVQRINNALNNESISAGLKDDIKELVRHYESLTYKEWGDRREYYIESMSDMVNDMGFDHEFTAKAMAQDHPTMQQAYMRLFKSYVEAMASRVHWDGRNEASVMLAKSIKEKVLDSPLPFV